MLTIRLLPVPKPSARFHDFADYERLVTASRDLGELTEVIVLLGGEAGLRCGEIAALEWRDVDHEVDRRATTSPAFERSSSALRR